VIPTVEYIPPRITVPDKTDPLDMELESIQQHCLKSWSENEIIARLEQFRKLRYVERSRLIDQQIEARNPGKYKREGKQ
jgi:hypothetical protein